jgi:hypothetical protein
MSGAAIRKPELLAQCSTTNPAPSATAARGKIAKAAEKKRQLRRRVGPSRTLKSWRVKADLKSERCIAVVRLELETSDQWVHPPCRTDRKCNRRIIPNSRIKLEMRVADRIRRLGIANAPAAW